MNKPETYKLSQVFLIYWLSMTELEINCPTFIQLFLELITFHLLNM